MKFYKYHGLGNDYLVLNPQEFEGELNPSFIQEICHRNYGIGSDGILLGPFTSNDADFGLQIFNPDGSEAEKSGNGLRIFARYLFDNKLVANEKKFTVATLGGTVNCTIHNESNAVSVEMGKAIISEKQTIDVDGVSISFYYVDIGNPHCVVIVDDATKKIALELGPKLETHSCFPKKTNVQFLEILDPQNIKIKIWERGAGYTLASGSSSCAAAFVAYKEKNCDNNLSVHMPGGILSIKVLKENELLLKGPVSKIGTFITADVTV